MGVNLFLAGKNCIVVVIVIHFLPLYFLKESVVNCFTYVFIYFCAALLQEQEFKAAYINIKKQHTINFKWMKSKIGPKENKMRARTETRKRKSCCEICLSS